MTFSWFSHDFFRVCPRVFRAVRTNLEIMDVRNKAPRAPGKNRLPGMERRWSLSPGPADSRLKISVLFTSMELTRTALKRAGALASRLRARITLIVPEVVPYPLSLESPAVRLAWNQKRLMIMARQSGVDRVCVYLCRDRLQTVESVLGSGSIVVVGCRKWWLAPERRLARKLGQHGFEVLLTEPE